MKNLENYIELIASASTPEEAFHHYCAIMKKHGYDRAVYTLITDHPSLELPRQHGLATSYPEHWMDHYIQEGYMDIDPVIDRISKSRHSFFWSDLLEKGDLSEDSIRMMNEARESGVQSGIGLSFCNNIGEITGIGLSQNDTDFTENKDYTFLACVHFLSSYFHETYRDMMTKPIQTSLTERETEILHWAAEGKTDEEIALITNITQNTVRFHWKNIFKKLEAYGRVYAITKALRLNLITPALVIPPYQKR